MKNQCMVFGAMIIALILLPCLFGTYAESQAEAAGPCHVWDRGVYLLVQTCTESGEKQFTCQLCGETKTEPVPPHHWYNGVLTTSLGTDPGEMHYTCLHCGEEKLVEVTGSIQGDVNEDSLVDMLDIIDLMEWYCGGVIEVNLLNGEINGDGCIDMLDVIVLMARYCGMETPASSFTYSVVNGGIRITEFIGTETDVIIPSAIDGYPVTELYVNVFSDCTSLESVVIPSTVTTIYGNAFLRCSNLKSVVLPDGLTELETSMFYGCSSLTTVDIPETVTNIEANVFMGCTSLQNVDIPDSVTSIGDWAFYNCENLRAVEIPAQVRTIEKRTFYGCKLLESMVIPNGVSSIGEDAFGNCSNLKDITIPASVVTFGEDIFAGCSADLTIHGYEDSQAESYANENGYTFIALPAMETPEECYAYTVDNEQATITGYMGVLMDVEIPSTLEGYPVTAIGDKAFYENTAITSVKLPEGVLTIGNEAFSNCISLSEVIMPDSVTSIGDSAFYGCTGMSEIDLSTGLTTIGNIAFENCTAIETIYIPSGVTTIGYRAFSGCTGLKSAILPDGITRIEHSLFNECTALEYVSLPHSLTYVGSFAFDNCGKLGEVNIPIGVSEISDYAFRDCVSLTNIDFPEGLTRIGSSAFARCTSLTKIVLPGSLKSLNNAAFSKCTSVTEIIVSEGITDLGGGHPFSMNPSLTKVTLPSTLKTISGAAFYECTGLEEIIIPEAVTSIGVNTFSGCSTLERVTVLSPDVTFGDTVFANCSSALIIYGIENSTTQTYANEYGITFMLVGQETPTATPTATPSPTPTVAPTVTPTVAPTAVPTIEAPELLDVEAESSTTMGLVWSAVENAAGYRVYRSTTGKNNSFEVVAIISAKEGTENYLYTDSGLTPATKYFYKIDAFAGSVSSEMSGEWAATTMDGQESTPTAAPTTVPTEIVEPLLIHPALSTDEDQLPSYAENDLPLVWGVVEGAVKYTVRMDESWDDDWDEIIKEVETTDETFTIPEDELYEGGLFRVRITAYGAAGETKKSDWYYFRIGAASYIWVKEKLEVGYEADDYSISICTSQNWEAYVSDSWITIDPDTGFASSSVDIEVEENEGDFPRTGTITITNDAGGYAILTVIQEGNGSSNEGNVKITYPKQGEVEYDRIDVEWTNKSYSSTYCSVELFDLTSQKLAYELSVTTADDAYIAKSKLTQGHIYRLTVFAYNMYDEVVAQASIIIKVESDASDTNPDDEVIETPEVPEGKTEIIYSGIVNNSTVAKADIAVSWQSVIGADYYAFALRDMTLYPDSMSESMVQKVINTTTEELEYDILGSQLVSGHTYRLWIAAHKDGTSAVINGKRIVFTVEGDGGSAEPDEPVEEVVEWTASLSGTTRIDVSVASGTPDANSDYLFIAEDANGAHYFTTIPKGTASVSLGIVSDLKMPRAAQYSLFVLPSGAQLTDSTRDKYFIEDIVVPLFDGNMITAVYSGDTNITNNNLVYTGDDITLYWEGSFGVHNVEVEATLNGQSIPGFPKVYTDPTLIDGDDPVKTIIDSSLLSAAKEGDELKITITVTPPTAEGKALLTGAKCDPIATKDWTGFYAVEVRSVDIEMYDGIWYVGMQPHQFKYTVYPQDANNKEIVWASSDTNVATVNQKGVVTPIGSGYVDIRATPKGWNLNMSYAMQIYVYSREEMMDEIYRKFVYDSERSVYPAFANYDDCAIKVFDDYFFSNYGISACASMIVSNILSVSDVLEVIAQNSTDTVYAKHMIVRMLEEMEDDDYLDRVEECSSITGILLEWVQKTPLSEINAVLKESKSLAEIVDVKAKIEELKLNNTNNGLSLQIEKLFETGVDDDIIMDKWAEVVAQQLNNLNKAEAMKKIQSSAKTLSQGVSTVMKYLDKLSTAVDALSFINALENLDATTKIVKLDVLIGNLERDGYEHLKQAAVQLKEEYNNKMLALVSEMTDAKLDDLISSASNIWTLVTAAVSVVGDQAEAVRDLIYLLDLDESLSNGISILEQKFIDEGDASLIEKLKKELKAWSDCRGLINELAMNIVPLGGNRQDTLDTLSTYSYWYNNGAKTIIDSLWSK